MSLKSETEGIDSYECHDIRVNICLLNLINTFHLSYEWRYLFMISLSLSLSMLLLLPISPYQRLNNRNRMSMTCHSTHIKKNRRLPWLTLLSSDWQDCQSLLYRPQMHRHQPHRRPLGWEGKEGKEAMRHCKGEEGREENEETSSIRIIEFRVIPYPSFPCFPISPSVSITLNFSLSQSYTLSFSCSMSPLFDSLFLYRSSLLLISLPLFPVLLITPPPYLPVSISISFNTYLHPSLLLSFQLHCLISHTLAWHTQHTLSSFSLHLILSDSHSPPPVHSTIQQLHRQTGEPQGACTSQNILSGHQDGGRVEASLSQQKILCERKRN